MSPENINTIDDYKLYVLQRYYNKLNDSNKLKVCAKIAELFQHNTKESIIYLEDLKSISESLPL